MSITPGLVVSIERTVGESDTASVLGSGDVDVLGTPAVVALCEQAAVRAVSDALSSGQTTVGVRVDIEHVAPTPPGGRVVARARLSAVNGRRLQFDVEASDERGVIARGSHSRVLVDRERFIDSVTSR